MASRTANGAPGWRTSQGVRETHSEGRAPVHHEGPRAETAKSRCRTKSRRPHGMAESQSLPALVGLALHEAFVGWLIAYDRPRGNETSDQGWTNRPSGG